VNACTKFSPPRPNGREGLMFPPEQSSKAVGVDTVKGGVGQAENAFY
jgi:hypothetical protein